MSEVCPRCLMRFPHHFVVRARCTKRWRGANFDEANAQAAVGAAVAGALGMSVRTSKDLEAFLRRAFVRSYGEGLDPNPTEVFDPNAHAESFDFHVGLREEVTPEVLAEAERAAREAVANARHFELRD